MAYVQGAANTAVGGTSFTDSFSSVTTSGNLIVVAVADDSGTTAEVLSVTDNKSNTYTKISATQSGTSPGLTLYYAKNITGGASHTITVNTNGFATNYGVVAQEFSGLDTVAPLDVTATAGGTSTSPASGSTATTNSANEQVVGAVAYGGSLPPSLGTGYSNLDSGVNSPNAIVGVESKTVSATGTQSAAFTLTSSASWRCTCVTFKLAGGGGSGGTSPTPAIPTFSNGGIYHATDLNALGSNVTNLYNFTMGGFRTYKPITVVRILRSFTAASGGYTTVQFDTVDFQSDGMYDSFLTNQGFLYLTARTAGVYRLYLQFTMAPGTSLGGFMEAHVCINGTSVSTNAVSGTYMTGRAVNSPATVALSVGDRIYGVVWQSTGAGVNSSVQYGGSYLVAEWLSP